MKNRDFLKQWGLSSLKLSLGFLNATFAPQDPDRAAAWDLYVELLTRVTTQHLPPDDGDEKTALESIHALFPLTRETLRKHGSGCVELTIHFQSYPNGTFLQPRIKLHLRRNDAKSYVRYYQDSCRHDDLCQWVEKDFEARMIIANRTTHPNETMLERNHEYHACVIVH